MTFYEQYVMPRFIDLACGTETAQQQRKRVVGLAEGRVLEMGFGSGFNLPLYDPRRVEKVIGVEPHDVMWSRSAKRRSQASVPVERIASSGEQLALDDGAVDTALVTYTICTIPDAVSALREMRRVLQPDGQLLFVEHREAPDPGVRKWQRRIDPLWTRISGGCHSGRPIIDYIRAAGWDIDWLESGYIPGPKPISYEYWGAARAA
ncbi:MAG: class I SAM-dependent methyltransferase [Myxococcales bacterium]|jgi:ubiquinone/menaquinone biosynthesis C-methylase UbiE